MPSYKDDTKTNTLQNKSRDDQLIDMKIRLDILEMRERGQEQVDMTTTTAKQTQDLLERLLETTRTNDKQIVHKVKDSLDSKQPKKAIVPVTDTTITKHITNITDTVLQLITNNVISSRDIQMNLGKSREHTARLLKKMYDDGYIKRDVENRPYTYSITEKGKSRLDSTIKDLT